MKTKKKALIFGITGQDGAYLSKFLLKKNYNLVGVTRNVSSSNLQNLKKLNVLDGLSLLKINNKNLKKINDLVLKEKPDEIYNLAGLSSVYQSFQDPYEAYISNTLPVINVLEAIKKTKKNIKYYNSGSGEIFGNAKKIVDENSDPKPVSPYGFAKLSSVNLVKTYRDSIGIHASSGLAFNHESILRSENFVTKKIISTAIKIYHGKDTRLKLGNINIERDWGWAPEYVEAMWMIMQQDVPNDLVLSTGKSITLSFFISEVFSKLNLSWEEHVEYDNSLIRPSELYGIKTKPLLAKKLLGWQAKYFSSGLIDKLLEEELKEINF